MNNFTSSLNSATWIHIKRKLLKRQMFINDWFKLTKQTFKILGKSKVGVKKLREEMIWRKMTVWQVLKRRITKNLLASIQLLLNKCWAVEKLETTVREKFSRKKSRTWNFCQQKILHNGKKIQSSFLLKEKLSGTKVLRNKKHPKDRLPEDKPLTPSMYRSRLLISRENIISVKKPEI